jgi:catechol 2,3-dioxygenase-like lactoylglutathione lyase family enzyme
MKRFHVHVHVADLESSMRFYSALFGAEPLVSKPDYAKWMLEDPRVNFAITSGAEKSAIDHLGFQVESDDDLSSIAKRLIASGQTVTKQEDATCCYAKGNKGWVTDPNGISWEAFHTFGESAVYGSNVAPRAAGASAVKAESYCTPAPACTSTACCSTFRAQI